MLLKHAFNNILHGAFCSTDYWIISIETGRVLFHEEFALIVTIVKCNKKTFENFGKYCEILG